MCDPFFILAQQNRTGGINQPPADRDERRALLQEIVLQAGQGRQTVRRGAPAQLGLTPPSAGAAARRVDQYDVEEVPPSTASRSPSPVMASPLQAEDP